MIEPKLLPLEYCTVERAARMLNIENSDIYYWNSIGAIELYNENITTNECEIFDESYEDWIPYNEVTVSLTLYVANPVWNDVSDKYIKFEGLEILFNAIYKNMPLPKAKTIVTRKLRNKRVDVAPVTLIDALLALIPELKSQLDAKRWKAPSIIDDYLALHNLPPVNLGENNFANWMKKSSYNKKI